MQDSHLTRFGSSLGSATSAAGVLRARASQMGIVLHPAGDVDLAAAAIGADVWLLATGAVDLGRAAGLAPGAPEALSRVLMRAAGRAAGPMPVDGPLPPQPDNSTLWRAADAYLEWAETVCGSSEPLYRAAEDLCIGSLRPVAEMLRSTADAANLTRPPV